jgi:hypothetical protein
VIYEHGESWWNDINWEKLLIHPPELSGYPNSSHLVLKQMKMAKEMINFFLTKHLFRTSKGSLTCHKILQHEANNFTSPPNKGVLRIFIALGRV